MRLIKSGFHPKMSKDNFIHLKRKAYSKEFCHALIGFFDLNTTLHTDGISGNGVYHNIKKDKEICLDLSNDWLEIKTPLLECINEYKKIYPGIDSSLPKWSLDSSCQLMRYEPGDAYWAEHCEDDTIKFGRAKRIFAWMAYLNNIDEGGGTRFTHQKFTTKPREGNLYIWPAGWTHLHKGMVAPKESKYILTGWFSYAND